MATRGNPANVPTYRTTGEQTRRALEPAYGVSQGKALTFACIASDETDTLTHGVPSSVFAVLYAANGGPLWLKAFEPIKRMAWQANDGPSVVHLYRHEASEGNDSRCVAKHRKHGGPCGTTVPNAADGEPRVMAQGVNNPLAGVDSASIIALAAGRTAHYIDVANKVHNIARADMLAHPNVATLASFGIDTKAKAMRPNK